MPLLFTSCKIRFSRVAAHIKINKCKITNFGLTISSKVPKQVIIFNFHLAFRELAIFIALDNILPGSS